jgi:hypothetical protein
MEMANFDFIVTHLSEEHGCSVTAVDIAVAVEASPGKKFILVCCRLSQKAVLLRINP